MAPVPPRLHHKAKLRLHLDDLTHSATQITNSSLDGGLYLARAVEHVLTYLYVPYGLSDIPRVRSVTVIVREMGGVAYTTGLPLDDLHKEIHLSLDYVQAVFSRNSTGIRHEIAGVITHEMVHCFQNNGHGNAPGGLIEGIADFVRLKAGLAPPHWDKSPTSRGEKWDEGYQRTAWFLEWIEEKKGNGSISRLNAKLRHESYDEKSFWHDLFGTSVETLWDQYKETWAKKETQSSTEAQLVEEPLVMKEGGTGTTASGLSNPTVFRS